MIFVSVVLIAGVSAMSIDLLQDEWNTFKLKHGKKYDPLEEHHRKQVFLYNKHIVEEHNQRYLRGETTYYMRINEFSDYFDTEINNSLYGFNITDYLLHVDKGATFIRPTDYIPEEINWEHRGAVTPVKNQRGCACCWAFSATGALEGQVFLSKNVLVSLSEQNLVDCDSRGDGCSSSGNMLSAFAYVSQNQGIDREDAYPYYARKQQCAFKNVTVGARSAGFTAIMFGNELILKEAVATRGPISIAFHAMHSFRTYKGGIYYEDRCNANNLNHAMLVVGYGRERNQDYWLVKNSWGTGWGLKGYAKVARNRGNNCGIATIASYPNIKL
ncbi:PREDICTED: cathepsin L1-like [Papilio polytes]|uniref:cathepsin L1-like n=1 Tax=Papilio polytes TaxID=76194 RepID=UPI0006768FD8|nr:PREDICTED: cathepsin L1-like [Papilio polytes]